MKDICLISPGANLTLMVEEDSNIRLDNFIAMHLSDYSRSFFQKLIKEKHVKVNNKVITKNSFKLEPQDKVEIKFPEKPKLPELDKQYQDLGVEVLCNNPNFLIVYKPAGVIVHKPQENAICFTLSDWLIHHFKEISRVGVSDRPGIVHRLDKDTSGILVIPRNECAHNIFSKLFKDREIKKTYLAIVIGHPEETGVIEKPISRHPVHRHKMTANLKTSLTSFAKTSVGRASKTYFKVIKYLKNAALLEVYPITGRTHQIRVHLASIGYPIIGDKVYGKESKLINRQALHAYKLEFNFNNQDYCFCKNMPQDMINLVEILENK